MGNFGNLLNGSPLGKQTFQDYAKRISQNGDLEAKVKTELQKIVIDHDGTDSNTNEINRALQNLIDTFQKQGTKTITFENFNSIDRSYDPTIRARTEATRRLGLLRTGTNDLLSPLAQAEAAFYLLNTDESGNLQELKAQAEPQAPTNNPPELATNQTNSTPLDATNKTLEITEQLLKATDDTSAADKLTYKLGTITGGKVYKMDDTNTKVEVAQGEDFTQEDIQNNKISFEWDTKTENGVGFAFEVADEAGAKISKNFVVNVKSTDTPAQTNTTKKNTKPTVKVTSNTKTLSTTENVLALNKTMLEASDKETQDATQLKYTIKGITGGKLKKEGQVLKKDETFTQADINNNLISFEWDKNSTANVGFTFQLSDGDASNPLTTTTTTFAVNVPGTKKTKLTEGLPKVQGQPVKINGLDDKQARHIIQASLKSPGIGVGENYPLFEEDFQSSISSNNNDVNKLIANFKTASGNILSESSGSKREIAQVQLWLDTNKATFKYNETIVQDGIYGPATKKAVKAFQTWYLSEKKPDYAPEKMFMDGIVGPYTQRAMYEVSKKYANFRAPDPETLGKLKMK